MIHRPDFPAPPFVEIRITCRQGGYSQPPFDDFNLALHVGDHPEAVQKNRHMLDRHLPASPHWLEQKHGAHVIEIPNEDHEADASITRIPDTVCAILTADCLPILLADRQAEAVAAIHAGWRGLSQDIIEATVTKMAIPPGRLWAYLGPAIGPECYEVGEEMIAAFKPIDRSAFYQKGNHWHCDLFALAKTRLSALGIKAVFSDFLCTACDPRFFSYRRDKTTGRMASLIWLAAKRQNP